MVEMQEKTCCEWSAVWTRTSERVLYSTHPSEGRCRYSKGFPEGRLASKARRPKIIPSYTFHCLETEKSLYVDVCHATMQKPRIKSRPITYYYMPSYRTYSAIFLTSFNCKSSSRVKWTKFCNKLLALILLEFKEIRKLSKQE